MFLPFLASVEPLKLCFGLRITIGSILEMFIFYCFQRFIWLVRFKSNETNKLGVLNYSLCIFLITTFSRQNYVELKV